MWQAHPRRLARAIRAALGRDRGGRWKVRSDPVRGRRRALDEESGYWAYWLAERGGKWADDFSRRFDADADVEDPVLREVLATLGPRRRFSTWARGRRRPSAHGSPGGS